MELNFLHAIIMGIVEGITEFLPISSTGHLIITSHLLGISGNFTDSFDIFIQLGAILAVIFEYRRDLFYLTKNFFIDKQSQNQCFSIIAAFIPAAVAGLIFGKTIKKLLFNPITVAMSLIIGGIIIILVEYLLKPQPKINDTKEVSITTGFKIGLFQILALIPGVSRSASTILGGIVLNLNRSVATEFSFYLAIPTLGAATIYEFLKIYKLLSLNDISFFIIGLFVSFLSALIVIKLFLRYVKTHNFIVFGIYRIILGFIICSVWFT